jgi:hypothetical protein
VTASRLLPAALLALTGCCGAAPGRLSPRTPAEYAEHAAEVRDDAPSGFTIVVVPPFVVAGEGPPDIVRAEAHEVVGRASAWMKAKLFPREPADILTLWMFEGEESYRRHVNILFGGVPPSPYGYYDPCEDALVVNVALGTGTLIHEMVHAFMEANIPGAPAWLNEGLASLFEQTEWRGDDLRGRVNWRLPGLQAAIAAGRAPRLGGLLATSRGEFYDEEQSGLNYAAARYLLYYLQDRGLLIDYFRGYVARSDSDSTGLVALLEILRERDIAPVQTRWEAFVARLPPP